MATVLSSMKILQTIIILSCIILVWTLGLIYLPPLTSKVADDMPDRCIEVYRFHPDEETTVQGRSFSVSPCADRPAYFIDISRYDLGNFTFATASSSNHFEESEDLIAGIQKVFPSKTTYYYDLGLSGEQKKKLQSWCGVVYRKFNFDPYPAHARDLHSYAFKPIIINEMMHEFDVVFWLDASGRFLSDVNQSHWDSVYSVINQTDGIAQFCGTGRDAYQCTNRGMYKYLPSDEDRLKSYMMICASAVLLYRTQFVYNEIVRWWYLCALTKDCIQPEGHNRFCSNSTPGNAKCHRYDQSALNILVANAFDFTWKTVYPEKRVLQIYRRVTHLYTLKANCSKSN